MDGIRGGCGRGRRWGGQTCVLCGHRVCPLDGARSSAMFRALVERPSAATSASVASQMPGKFGGRSFRGVSLHFTSRGNYLLIGDGDGEVGVGGLAAADAFDLRDGFGGHRDAAPAAA